MDLNLHCNTNFYDFIFPDECVLTYIPAVFIAGHPTSLNLNHQQFASGVSPDQDPYSAECMSAPESIVYGAAVGDKQLMLNMFFDQNNKGSESGEWTWTDQKKVFPSQPAVFDTLYF